MVGFDVTVNGQHMCLAATGDKGVLHAYLISGGSDDSRKTMIGVNGRDDNSGMKLAWPARELQIGDEILIRLVETDTRDPKPLRYKPNPANEPSNDD